MHPLLPLHLPQLRLQLRPSAKIQLIEDVLFQCPSNHTPDHGPTALIVCQQLLPPFRAILSAHGDAPDISNKLLILRLDQLRQDIGSGFLWASWKGVRKVPDLLLQAFDLLADGFIFAAVAGNPSRACGAFALRIAFRGWDSINIPNAGRHLFVIEWLFRRALWLIRKAELLIQLGAGTMLVILAVPMDLPSDFMGPTECRPRGTLRPALRVGDGWARDDAAAFSPVHVLA